MKKRRPVFCDPPFLVGVLVQVRLDPEVQIPAILLIERNEPKCLLRGRQRAQHLRAAEHWSRVAEKHQTDLEVRI